MGFMASDVDEALGAVAADVCDEAGGDEAEVVLAADDEGAAVPFVVVELAADEVGAARFVVLAEDWVVTELLLDLRVEPTSLRKRLFCVSPRRAVSALVLLRARQQ